MKFIKNRLDPSALSPEDFREVERLLTEVFSQPRASLVSADGSVLALPEPIYQLLVSVLVGLRERKAMVLLPEDETFTTQAAADYLGMSRPFLISLLEEGKIPYHRVGSHRRIYFKDLNDYQRQRDTARRNALEEFRDQLMADGLDEDDDSGE